MKKCLLFLILIIASIGVVSAQNYQEVVYLKNGSVVRGVIIEQIPNQRLKIQTSDGNIFVYTFSEVEKITKERMAVAAGQSYTNDYTYQEKVTKEPRVKSSSNDAFLPTPCYKGFFDFGYTVGVGEDGEGRVTMSTTHGAQINPHFFMGVGLGFNYFHLSECWNLPIYADFRANFLKGKITPFIDFRIGYSVGDASGLYFSPSLGCNFGFGNKSGFSISLGYEYQKADFYYYYYDYYYDYIDTYRANCGGFVIKLGVDF